MKMTMTIKKVLAMMMTTTITSFTTMVRIIVTNIRQPKEMVAAISNKTCILYFDKILPKIT